jgi:hypothetical protein
MRAVSEKALFLLDFKPIVITISGEKRNAQMNALLWARLTDISRQVEWYGQKLSPEDWKHVMTAGLKKQRAVPGIEGGFVVLGLSTSKMKKAEFSELLDLIQYFGDSQGVKWSDNRYETDSSY